MKRWLIPVAVLALGAGAAWANDASKMGTEKIDKVEQKGTTASTDARSMVLPLIASVESVDAKTRAIFALADSERPDLKAVETLADSADKDVHAGLQFARSLSMKETGAQDSKRLTDQLVAACTTAEGLVKDIKSARYDQKQPAETSRDLKERATKLYSAVHEGRSALQGIAQAKGIAMELPTPDVQPVRGTEPSTKPAPETKPEPKPAPGTNY